MAPLIDTDVMIAVFRGNAAAASYLDSLSDPAISIVTAQELIVGARDMRDLAAIDSLVSAYPVIHNDVTPMPKASVPHRVTEELRARYFPSSVC